MATRARTAKVADTAANCGHGVPENKTCWRCCEADMAAHLQANGIDAGRYFDGRNGEGTPEPRERGNGGNNTAMHAPEPATNAQVWKIRHERDRRDTSRVQIPADADIPGMSKRAATALIKKLLDRALCPLLPADQPRRQYAPRAATPGQRSYVTDLLAERVHADPVDVDALTFDQASALIGALVRAPRLVDASTLADGMYRKDGIMYRVKTDKHGRKMCHRGVIVADEIRNDDGAITTPAVIKFRSDPCALASLTEADLMTEAQVCEFGVSYGICVYGHALTDPVSVAAGIGPKCAANAGIDQLEVAISNGYVPPVKAARKTRAPRATGQPAEAAPVSDAPAEAVTEATEAYASPWSMI